MANNMEFMVIPGDHGALPADDNEPGQLYYTLTATATTINLFVKAHLPTVSQDSFFYEIPGLSTWTLYNNDTAMNGSATGFVEIPLVPITGAVIGRTYTLKILRREAGAELASFRAQGASFARGTGGDVIVTPPPPPPPIDVSADVAACMANPNYSDGDGDRMNGPAYPLPPEYTVAANVPRGKIISYRMSGANSKFYIGDRDMKIYIPAGYVSGTETPFIVVQDGVHYGGAYFNGLVPVLDNLIFSKKLPSMVAVFADPGANRDLEYKTPSDKNALFFEAEVLPEARRQVMMQAGIDINLTKDPEGRAAMGGSGGGIGAVVMAWFTPHLYHRALSFSGTWDGKFDTRIANSPVLPLRIYLQEGTKDDMGSDHSEVLAKQLKDKGYHYVYLLSQDATHTPQNVIRSFEPEALKWLWRCYPIK